MIRPKKLCAHLSFAYTNTKTIISLSKSTLKILIMTVTQKIYVVYMKVQVGVQGVGKGQVNTHSHPHILVCSVAQLRPTLCEPMDCNPPGSSVHGISQVEVLEWVAISSPRGSSQHKNQTCISCNGRQILYHWPTKESESRSVVSNSLPPCELCSPWNSLGQNTGVGSLSLLHGIFPTKGSNPDLLHCRQILYQLSHQGRPS